MFKTKMALCALLVSAASSSAFAADITQGTVTFNGKLNAETCNIVSDNQNITVTLPTLSIASLTATGNEAGSKTFDIKVEKCPTTISDVAAHFEAINSDGFDAVTKNLTNSVPAASTPAKNVEIRLYDKDGKTQLPVGSTGGFFTPDSSGNATLTYMGGYYATGATTAGPVAAKVAYTLAYK